MGLLQARETERIGAGPAGFIQIQTHPWFREVDWEAVLRREVRAPWVPPSSGDSAVDQQIDFEREDVRAHPPTWTHAHAHSCTYATHVRHARVVIAHAAPTPSDARLPECFRVQVMREREYDLERWADTFKEFGPKRVTPWPGEY